MDLEKRIEEISKVRSQFAEMRTLRIAADNAAKKWEQATADARKNADGKVENENDQRRIDMLEHAMKKAQAKLADANKKFTEDKSKLETELLAEVNQELSVYREKGDDLSTEEATKRWGMPTAGATTIDAQNYDNRQTVNRIESQKQKHVDELKDVEADIDEILKNGDKEVLAKIKAQKDKELDQIEAQLENTDYNSEEMTALMNNRTRLMSELEKVQDNPLEYLKSLKGELEINIKRCDIAIAKFSVPYKAMEDNQAEYDALFEFKSAVEKMSKIDPKHYNEQGFDAEIKALESIAEAREENIPAEDRYSDLKGKKAAASKKKIEAKNTIESLKEKLAKGKIGKDYVDSVRARIEELKGEVSAYEKQEQEYAGKMQKLEEKYNLKPEPTAMEKYEKQVEQYKKLQEIESKKQAELDKVNEKLKNDPDNKTLQEQKEKLDKDLAKIKAAKPKIEKDIEEAKKLLGIDDKGKGKGDDDDDKGKGKGDDDDKGKGKGDDDDKGKGKGDDDDKGKGKGDDDDKGKGKGDDDDKGKGKGDDDDKGKGKGDEGKISATDYYSSLGLADKHKTKVQAWERWKGKDAGLLTKALMWLPRPGMKKISEQYLEEGYIDPLYDGVKLLGKGEEPKPAPTKEDKGAKKEPEKDPFKADEETIKKTEEAAKAAAQKEKDAAILAQMNELLAKCPPDQKENLLKAFAARTGVKPEIPKAKAAPEKGGAEK